MGKKKKPKKGTPYTPRPTVPAELNDRYTVTMEVLAGRLTVSEGAKLLGLSRVQYQSIVHRTEAAMIEAMKPKPSGRPAASEREKELSSEVNQLERQLSQSEERLQMMEDFLLVASELVQEKRLGILSRPRTTKRRPPGGTTGSSGTDSEPERRPTRASDEMVRAQADSLLRLRRTGALAAVVVAKVVGVSEATARRRLRAEREGWSTSARRGRPPRQVSDAQHERASAIVRVFRKLIGAERLARMVGVTRRAAAAIKTETLAELERERKAGTASVRVRVPGVVRGFDAMHAVVEDRPHYLLASADGAVPYRTKTEIVPRYDGGHVAAHLDADFADNGAPLVLRYDRASSHRTPEVLDVLAQHGVLPLHGPPRHPRYYGQLERQNREHRVFLGDLRHADIALANEVVEQMRVALNDLYPRPSLGGATAGALFTARPALSDDRALLRDEVTELAARLERDQELEHSIAWRYAVEHALSKRGYLTIERRAEVLSEFNGRK